MAHRLDDATHLYRLSGDGDPAHLAVEASSLKEALSAPRELHIALSTRTDLDLRLSSAAASTCTRAWPMTARTLAAASS